MTGLVVAAVLTCVAFVAAAILIARRTGWEAEEVLAAAPAVVLLVTAGARFVFYLLELAPIADVLLWAGIVIGALLGWGDVARGLASPAARRLLGAWAVLALWVIGLAFLVRNYGAGNVNTDWIEHYLRARFFLGGQPWSQRFIGAELPGRPPLVNLAAAEVMAIAGKRFPAYQIAMTLFALAGFFPLLLLAREFAPRARRLAAALAGWLMFSPMFVVNATYTWTKPVAAWLVIAATAFYLRGRRLEDERRIVFAFLLAAAATLAHYSAGPYALFLGVHYLAVVWPARPAAWRELAAIAAVVVLVLAPWLGWAASIYGPRALVTTTAPYNDAARYEGPSQAGKVLLNVRDTIVPNFVRGATSDARARLTTWGGLRETTFMAYMSNVLFGPGLLGIALILIDRARRAGSAAATRGGGAAPRGGGAGFWIGFVATGFIGIAANGAREHLGLAHLSLQPVVLAAIALLAARFTGWPAWMRVLAAGGLACDLLLGIALHFWLQSYPLDLPVVWTGPLGLTFDDLMIGTTQSNWMLKMGHRLVFAGDRAAAAAPVVAALLVPLAVAGFALLWSSAKEVESPPA